MIPIRDYVKSKSFPLFNTVFILVNLFVFLRQLILPDAGAYAFVMEYAFVADRFLASPLEFWHTPFTTLFFHGGTWRSSAGGDTSSTGVNNGPPVKPAVFYYNKFREYWL